MPNSRMPKPAQNAKRDFGFWPYYYSESQKGSSGAQINLAETLRMVFMGLSNGSGFSIKEEEVDRHSQHIEEKGKATHDEKSNKTFLGRRT